MLRARVAAHLWPPGAPLALRTSARSCCRLAGARPWCALPQRRRCRARPSRRSPARASAPGSHSPASSSSWCPAGQAAIKLALREPCGIIMVSCTSSTERNQPAGLAPEARHGQSQPWRTPWRVISRIAGKGFSCRGQTLSPPSRVISPRQSAAPYMTLCSSPSTHPGGQGWQAANDPALARHTCPHPPARDSASGPGLWHARSQARPGRSAARPAAPSLPAWWPLPRPALRRTPSPPKSTCTHNRSAGESCTLPQNDIRNKPSSHAKPSSRQVTHPRSATDTAMAEMFSETASTRVMAVDCRQDRCARSADRGAQLQRAQVYSQCRKTSGRGGWKGHQETSLPWATLQNPGWLHCGFCLEPCFGTWEHMLTWQNRS